MRRITTVALLALLAGCGGSASFKSARDAGEAIGCTNAERSEVIGASDTIACDYRGDRIRVSRFGEGDDLDSFKQVADAFQDSPLAGEILYGGNIAIECTSSCDRIKEKLEVE